MKNLFVKFNQCFFKNKALFYFIHFNLKLVLFILVVCLLGSCVRYNTAPLIDLKADMELVTDDGKFILPNNDTSFFFKGGKYRTSKVVRSGKYSVYSARENAFTLAIDFPGVYNDSYVDVSVWKKGNDAHLVCVILGTKKYFSVENPIETDSNGWEKLNLKFYIPPVSDYCDLKFYLWNSGQDTVYYDDLKLSITKDREFPIYSLEPFRLEMDTSEILSLLETRKKAFKKGILQSSDDDWVKGFAIVDDKMMKAKLRLKGDWLDHLYGPKWSYRVKVRKGKAWKGMKVFSLQNPMARLGTNEWFLHKFMISEGLLTTRYGFIPLTLNGRNLGLYAWEEHFAKQLLESQLRREGPIVRFKEDALWDGRVIDDEEKMNNKQTPVFDVAVIKPFSSGKVIGDTAMFNKFLIAQNLMMQYRSRSKTASEIFNVEMLAKYFAIADVFLARHSLIWHNQRFYYNPVLCKLEPIAYDCYSDVGVEESIKNPITGFLRSGVTQSDEYIMVRELFNDTVFVDQYIKYLDKYSNREYLDSLFIAFSPQTNFYDSLIAKEYPYSKFYVEEIMENAKNIRDTLGDYVATVKEMRKKDQSWENHTLIRNDYDTILPPFFSKNLILAYKENATVDSSIIKVKNYYPHQVIVLGIGKLNSRIREVIVPTPTIKGSRNGVPQEVNFVASNDKINYLFYSVLGSDKMFSIEINQWPEPTGEDTPLQKLIAKHPFPDTALISNVVGNKVIIKSGSLSINKPVIIPGGYQVIFNNGTTIDMINSSSIISFSPVLMNGTSEDKIIITSSDFSSKGFLVMQADGRSKVDNVWFENLNTIDYNAWTLTGAVTFYESDVDISNTTFYRNQCEDGLNIIRSDFNVTNSNFNYIYADAFDADFCNGNIINCNYENIGNDAMDFSGSLIVIRNSSVINANDKGISGGEDSKLKIFDTKITKSNIGLASKDLSVVEVFDTDVSDCNYGVVLLQKKIEYGPSEMRLNNTSFVSCKTEMLIEEGSKVILEGNETIMGQEKNLSSRFY